MPGVLPLQPFPVFEDPNQSAIHENATVTASGSSILTGYGASEVSLFINVKAAPTGTTPTIQYTIQEVDPGDGTTVIGNIATSTVITGVTIERITLESTFGGSIKISWTVGGAAPSFTQVYSTLVAKQGSAKITDGTNTATVKPASTTPVATDQALVVTVSPNTDSLTVDTTQLPAALVGGRLDSNVGAWFGATTPTVGQKAMAASIPVTIASDQTVIPVNDNSGSLTVDTPQLPAALVGGRLDANVGAWFGSTAPTVGQKVMASSIPVTFASDQTPLSVTFATVGARDGVSSARLVLGGGTAGTRVVMRSTTYNEPATAVQRSMASSAAADTGAGVGARTVRITYFDNTGAGPFTEDVTLNGVTTVDTVNTNIRFIESLICITVGSTGTNVGTITLFGATGGGGGVVGTIGIGNIFAGAGDGRTLWAHHYCPLTYTCKLSVLVVSAQSGGSGTNGLFYTTVTKPLTVNSSEVLIGDTLLVQGSFQRTFSFNPSATGLARFTVYGIPGTNNATLTAAFDWSETLT